MKSSIKNQHAKVCPKKTIIKRIRMKSDKKIIMNGEFRKKSNKKIISDSINSN
jgi:hypothetical protein